MSELNKCLGKIEDLKFGIREDNGQLSLDLMMSTQIGTCFFSVQVDKIKQLLKDAMKTDISQLVNVPIELTYSGHNTHESFRILTEVL